MKGLSGNRDADIQISILDGVEYINDQDCHLQHFLVRAVRHCNTTDVYLYMHSERLFELKKMFWKNQC